jgi:flavin reductase (DIM6/NTAB) family NADH-FMN oxidoreductase RutF
MKTYDPHKLTPRQRHQYIIGTVNPRPICFASTVDGSGRPNLAPYSFFNVFCSTPPILAFSIGGRNDGSEKDTLRNIRETGEVVINLVNYPMARQMAICGVEYAAGIDEFTKAGLTPVPSQLVKPFRVKESPAQYECKVLEIKPLGDEEGEATLIIAQAILMHIDENIFAPDGYVDPTRIDMVGRLGGFNYCRADAESVFSIKQPPGDIAIGFDNLPKVLKESKVLTGHHLAMLAGVVELPSQANVEAYKNSQEYKEFLASPSGSANEQALQLQHKVKELLEQGNIEEAWMLFLVSE